MARPFPTRKRSFPSELCELVDLIEIPDLLPLDQDGEHLLDSVESFVKLVVSHCSAFSLIIPLPACR